MRHAGKQTNILYCSFFRSHRAHRELVRLASENNCSISAVPWHRSNKGTYTGPISIDAVISHLDPLLTSRLATTTGDVPHVTLHSQTANELNYPGAVCNHVAAGRLVAEHYLSLGFRRFAAFVDTESYDTFAQRFQGYQAAIAEAGLSAPQEVSLQKKVQNSYIKILKSFAKAIKTMPIPLAVMAANDRVAAEIMDACRMNDLSIPSQVAVCGFDNDPIVCDLSPIALSSVDTNPELQAREAFKLLLSVVKGDPPSPDPIIIEPRKLVVRKSSGLQAQESSTVAKALSYIHEHIGNSNLSIPLIVERTGISRTNLFESFRRSLSITPLQYITSIRIDRAKELLRDTDQKLVDIRPLCGFSTDYQMYQAFKRTTGKSPGSFRRA